MGDMGNLGETVETLVKKVDLLTEQVVSSRAAAAPKPPGQHQPLVCYGCGTPGHVRRDCPRPKTSPESKRVAFVGTEESENSSGSEEEATLRPNEGMAYADQY